MLQNMTPNQNRPLSKEERAQNIQDITTDIPQTKNGPDPPRNPFKDTGSLPKPCKPSPNPSNFCTHHIIRRHMDGLFGGLVLQDAGLSKRANASRYYPLDSGEGLRGEAQKVVEEAVGHLDNPVAKAQLVSKAKHLALSCGKISIKLKYDTETNLIQQSGFWFKDDRGKYFVTAQHFVGLMFKSLDVNGLDQMMEVFRDEGESYVGSTFREDDDDSPTVQVKLKSWEETSDTAVFEPISNDDDIRYCANLDDIGYFTPDQKKRVFIAGYCGKDERLSLQGLVEKVTAAGMEGDDIKFIHGRLQQNARGQVSLFHFLKEFYAAQLGTYSFSKEDRDKACHLRAKSIEFSDIFISDTRATAGGHIGMWDTRGMQPPQPTNNTYSFSQLTDISLYPGLSGAPVIGFVGERFQILAKVYGGRANALLNDVMAFKEGYRAKMEELIGR